MKALSIGERKKENFFLSLHNIVHLHCRDVKMLTHNISKNNYLSLLLTIYRERDVNSLLSTAEKCPTEKKQKEFLL